MELNGDGLAAEMIGLAAQQDVAQGGIDGECAGRRDAEGSALGNAAIRGTCRLPDTVEPPRMMLLTSTSVTFRPLVIARAEIIGVAERDIIAAPEAASVLVRHRQGSGPGLADSIGGGGDPIVPPPCLGPLR